jgi:hypothetical protein
VSNPFRALVQPSWITKRDGRLVPFEADKISRSLFAATESLGHPDPFVSRELTDGVLHFLSNDEGRAPTTAEVAELVIKVVRELGQPALSKAYALGKQQHEPANDVTAPPAESSFPRGRMPSVEPLPALAQWINSESNSSNVAWRAGQAYLQHFSLRHVYSRDLAAAHADGLLVLTGLEAPLELAGVVCAKLTGQRLAVIDVVQQSRALAGEFVVFDGPQFLARGEDDEPAAEPVEFVEELLRGLSAARLRGIVNLNCAEPPAWANRLVEGPLYHSSAFANTHDELHAYSEGFIEPLRGTPLPLTRLRIDWHLGSNDFEPNRADRLSRVARASLDGLPIAFVFDRQRRAIALAEGLDRPHAAVLLRVGLDLARLAEQAQQWGDLDAFFRRLEALARLGRSAGLQKREFLRQQSQHRPKLVEGFLLERARLVLTPAGLWAAAGRLVSGGVSGLTRIELASQIVRRLRDLLTQEAVRDSLEGVVDSALDFHLPTDPMDGEDVEIPLQARSIAGITCWEVDLVPLEQIKCTSVIQAAAGNGTAAVLLPSESSPAPQDLIDWLRFAWRRTEIRRLRFVRLDGPATRPAAR